jgi:uncharacterized SAM-binding protein YcdF (DUF218 family)
MSLTGLIESLLQPVGMIWVSCLVAGVVAWRKRQRGWAGFNLGIVLLLHALGGTNAPAWLLSWLERPYDPLVNPLPAAGADAVVMLGGAHAYCRRTLTSWDAGEPSDRILAAIELMRQGRAHTLVLGGAGYELEGVKRPDSEPVVAWMKRWNLAPANLIELGICRDTRDEAFKTAELVRQRGWKRVVVVTSGYHLRRAEGVFRQAGVPVEMVGAEFQGLEALGSKFTVRAVPDAEGFRLFRYWLHEELGLIYYRLRGWI